MAWRFDIVDLATNVIYLYQKLDVSITLWNLCINESWNTNARFLNIESM